MCCKHAAFLKPFSLLIIVMNSNVYDDLKLMFVYFVCNLGSMLATLFICLSVCICTCKSEFFFVSSAWIVGSKLLCSLDLKLGTLSLFQNQTN